MNNKLDDFKNFIKNKKVAVLGVGISNKPLIKFIAKLGAQVTAFDQADYDSPQISATRNEFFDEGLDINWSCGGNYLEKLSGYEVIFKTPKIRFDIPQILIERSKGAIVTSEMEVFMECCPCKTIAVTGSDGKTTTTTIIGLLLKHAGYNVHIGGNIGTPLLDRLEEIDPNDIVVLELSSFQLSTMRKSPNIAVITNISPNHLDVHLNYEEYVDSKKNIFLYQGLMDLLVLNSQNVFTKSFASNARCKVVCFNKPSGTDFDYDNEYIYFNNNKLSRRDVLAIGSHNAENYCAALACVSEFITFDDLKAVATSFTGVEHRIEYIRELNGIAYYNSSIDSSPTRSIATIKAFTDMKKKLVPIMGGKDKNSDYTNLGAAVLSAASKIIVCGENSKMIIDSIVESAKESKREVSIVDMVNTSISRAAEIVTIEIALNKVFIFITSSYADAVKIASSITIGNESILLTPAGTSFDNFKNFEERGNTFKSIVNGLEPVQL